MVRWNGGRYDQNKVKALYAAMDEAHFRRTPWRRPSRLPGQ